MNYIGKLYGKIGNKYFDTSHDTNEFDDLFEFKQLFQRNFKAVVDRGLITNNTTDEEFLSTIAE